MRVLVACEYSGVVRESFRALGHSALSCDLLPADDGSPHHYQGDVRDVLDAGWDLMIAHPPCTYLCGACAWAFKDGPYHQRVKPGTLVGAARRAAREDALAFVRLLLDAPIPRKALENPVGCISTRIRPPDQIIHPHQFGDDASKATCLWLENLPRLRPTKSIDPRFSCSCGAVFGFALGKYGCPNCHGEGRVRPIWGNQTPGGQNRLPPSEDRWKIRSETFPGIAAAFADQWGSLDVVPGGAAQGTLF